MPHAPDWGGVLLLVQFDALIVDPAIEMDGELRDSQDGVGPHQPRLTTTQKQPTGQTELTVQPGVEQWSSVDLHSELLPAVAADIGTGLQLERGRVRV